MKSIQNCINILIVGLENQFCKMVAEQLSERLQMHYTSCEGIVSYYVNEKDLILQKVGLDYLKKKEKQALKECSNFHDCVLSINYDYFKHNINFFANSVICYLKIENNKKLSAIEKINFFNSDKFLQENSHITIDLKKNDANKAVKSIIKNLGEIL